MTKVNNVAMVIHNERKHIHRMTYRLFEQTKRIFNVIKIDDINEDMFAQPTSLFHLENHTHGAYFNAMKWNYLVEWRVHVCVSSSSAYSIDPAKYEQSENHVHTNTNTSILSRPNTIFFIVAHTLFDKNK